MRDTQHEEETQKQITETFCFYRGLIMDLFEQEIGSDKKWPFIRSRLLKILSPDRGLEAKIIAIVQRSRKKV
ncbi:hypothetical protein [Bdellovibrio sp. KM01]|uniref:hypothetical protein n=1 Tax=Bdellovibrio sp. KM01 TaxID=2748865 RepID=UPI0015EAE633|nr:hypothetical protein [Bdellovibrio sp. KM01]QLY25691.1 hypothetical protein HW988_01160 [Bdellovibrio sp. KM01]